MQFYNDQNCGLLKPGFNSSLDFWLNLPGPGESSDAFIVLGVPGDNMIDDAGDPKYGYFVPADEVRVSRLEMDFKD